MEWPTPGNTVRKTGKVRCAGGGAVQRPADLGKRYGGIMYVRRAIIIPAILALGVAGSLLSGPAMSGTAVHAAGVHVHAAAAPANPKMPFHN